MFKAMHIWKKKPHLKIKHWKSFYFIFYFTQHFNKMFKILKMFFNEGFNVFRKQYTWNFSSSKRNFSPIYYFTWLSILSLTHRTSLFD